MSLDCITTRGKVYIGHQAECLKHLSEVWNVEMVTTSESDSADVDAIATRNGQVSAVMEIKSREMDLAQLKRFGSYLITFEKLLKLRTIAAGLRVPGFVVVSLLKDQSIVFWKICDMSGNLLVNLEAKVTETQATCNGGQANRYNAYLSLSGMGTISMKKDD
jgi:hypothetical protein